MTAVITIQVMTTKKDADCDFDAIKCPLFICHALIIENQVMWQYSLMMMAMTLMMMMNYDVDSVCVPEVCGGAIS